VDIVNPSAPLTEYKLVIAPALNIMTPELAEHLADFVRHGGHLVLGARTGMKDQYNALLPSRQPGKVLSDLLGGDVVEFYALDTKVPAAGSIGSGEATTWAEMLEGTSPDTEILLRFGKSNGWLDDKPAMISRKVGTGRITYVGGQFDEKLMQQIAKWMTSVSAMKPAFGEVPEGVDVSRRVSSDGREVFVLVNFSKQPQAVPLAHSMRELLHGKSASASLTLAAGDVAVLVTEK
jgi:beta-galactosidase